MDNLSSGRLKRNLFFNCIHEFSWGFAVAFHSIYAIIPLFLKKLGAPDAIIISIAGLFNILLAIPMLFSAALGRNIRNIQTAVVKTHSIVLPPIFFAGFLFAFIVPTGPNAWVYYYVCFIFYCLAIGFIIPIWAGFLSHVFPKKTRGHYLGISFAFNSLGGFFGGILVKMLFNSSVSFPQNFGWGFIIAGSSMAIGIMVFLLYKLDYQPTEKIHKTFGDFWTDTKTIIQKHGNFKYYLFSRMFITAHFPAVSLYAVYTQDLFGYQVSEAGIFTIIQVVAFGIGSVSAGKIGDKWGHKTAMILSFFGYFLAIVWAVLANSMLDVYMIFLFLGLGNGGFMPSAMNMVYDFAETRDVKTYMALIDTFLAPIIILMVAVASMIKPLIGTRNLFILLGGTMLIGLLLLTFRVQEPRRYPHVG